MTQEELNEEARKYLNSIALAFIAFQNADDEDWTPEGVQLLKEIDELINEEL
jgi:hypothetical protein